MPHLLIIGSNISKCISFWLHDDDASNKFNKYIKTDSMMLILQIPRLHNEHFFSFYWLKLLQIVTIFLYSNIKFNLWENKKGSSCKKYCIKLKSIVIWTLTQWYVIYIIWKSLEKHIGIIYTNLDSYKNRIKRRYKAT